PSAGRHRSFTVTGPWATETVAVPTMSGLGPPQNLPAPSWTVPALMTTGQGPLSTVPPPPELPPPALPPPPVPAVPVPPVSVPPVPVPVSVPVVCVPVPVSPESPGLGAQPATATRAAS